MKHVYVFVLLFAFLFVLSMVMVSVILLTLESADYRGAEWEERLIRKIDQDKITLYRDANVTYRDDRYHIFVGEIKFGVFGYVHVWDGNESIIHFIGWSPLSKWAERKRDSLRIL